MHGVTSGFWTYRILSMAATWIEASFKQTGRTLGRALLWMPGILLKRMTDMDNIGIVSMKRIKAIHFSGDVAPWANHDTMTAKMQAHPQKSLTNLHCCTPLLCLVFMCCPFFHGFQNPANNVGWINGAKCSTHVSTKKKRWPEKCQLPALFPKFSQIGWLHMISFPWSCYHQPSLQGRKAQLQQLTRPESARLVQVGWSW